jgi:hypothetical protein
MGVNVRTTTEEILDRYQWMGWTAVSGEHIARPDPVDAWCRQNIGDLQRWERVGYDYWFRRKEDAVWFSLRWA